MKRKFLGTIFPILVLIITLAGCGSTPAAVPTATEMPVTQVTPTETATPMASVTPDPCAPGQIEAEVQKVHRHMREFDDASVLASNVPREQLGNAIANLQKIRRDAEDEPIPACLTNLKTYQIEHMNSVINTLLAFMSKADQQTVDQGISAARQQHDQYTLELARLLGLTVVPATASGTGAPTETPKP
jgi:hypothetical protein